MINSKATSGLLTTMKANGADNAELAIVIDYSKKLIDIEKLYSDKVKDIATKYFFKDFENTVYTSPSGNNHWTIDDIMEFK